MEIIINRMQNTYSKDGLVLDMSSLKFQETGRDIARDRSRHMNHGMCINETNIIQTKEGICAGSFDGVNDYMEVPDNASLNPGSNDFTAEVWFKLNSAGSQNDSILYNKDNLYETSAGGGYFRYAWKPHWNWDCGTSFPVNVGEWYHAVVVYEHINQYVYKNGQLVYSRAQTGDMGTNTNALTIGAKNASGDVSLFFTGLIDEVRIYNRALSAEEVRGNMFASKRYKYMRGV